LLTIYITMLTNLSSESSNEFTCDLCDYKTSRHSQYQRHITTSKHQNNEKSTFCQQKSTKINNYSSELVCSCGKVYKERTGLWRHKKKCKIDNETDEKNDSLKSIDKDELIIQLLKQNAKLMEILENGTHNTTNNTTNNTNNTNSHNKAFNLNFFLNETCKNAMNITDFIDSIKLQLPDLIDVGELGYVEGISKIIVKNLNNLDETERPIHCTDKKRETMYVKDHGQWEKEDEKNTKLTKAVKRVANKNIDLLPRFREKYPEYSNSSSKISDKYDKMVIEVMETDPLKNEKIIRNISKVTTIKSN
jgi:hypothetical protein